jgi:hypothetical protein
MLLLIITKMAAFSAAEYYPVKKEGKMGYLCAA